MYICVYYIYICITYIYIHNTKGTQMPSCATLSSSLLLVPHGL